MARITGSVGERGVNIKADVELVQTLVNRHIRSIAPLRALQVDGRIGPKTIEAIKAFQRNVVRLSRPDGRVDPGGRTLGALDRPAGTAPPPPATTPQQFQYPRGPQEPLADIARPYIGAMEASGNQMGTDPRMREIFEADSLMSAGDTDGYPWCCSFISMCVQKLIGQSPHYAMVHPPKTASVLNFRTRWAPAQNCLVFPPNHAVHSPHKGDVVVFTFSHIGVVDEVGTNMVYTIEGNTNEAGSREGTSVLRKSRAFGIIRCFIRLPIPASYDVANQICVA